MQHLSVPDVFVIPPEEEQHETPPWCFFDAAEAAKDGFSTTPDIDTLTVALDFHQQMHNAAPAFHRSLGNDSEETIVMPRKPSPIRLPESLINRGERVRSRDLDDSEIVEVVKVRRNEGREDVAEPKPQTLKKSKTFRMRATDALKSIKNVGKGSRKNTSETWASQENVRESRSEDIPQRETLPRPNTPNMSKRKSVMFTQFFTLSQTKSAGVSADFSEPPMSPTMSEATHRGSVHNVQSLNALPPSRSPSQPSLLRTCPSLEDYGDTPNGRTSPVPTLSKKSFRARISVLDLHRLFSPSSSSTAPEELNMATSPSSDSHDEAQDLFSPSESRESRYYSLDSTELSPSSSGFTSSVSGSSMTGRTSPVGFQGETDAEMRLDSLHFDSLHFDPGEF